MTSLTQAAAQKNPESQLKPFIGQAGPRIVYWTVNTEAEARQMDAAYEEGSSLFRLMLLRLFSTEKFSPNDKQWLEIYLRTAGPSLTKLCTLCLAGFPQIQRHAIGDLSLCESHARALVRASEINPEITLE